MKYIIVTTDSKKQKKWHEFNSEEEQVKTFNQWRENVQRGGCCGTCDCYWANGDSFGYCFDQRVDLIRSLKMVS